MRMGREAWILIVLLLAFVISTVFLTKQSTQQEERERPSSYNTSRTGSRALYDLFAAEGLKTRRLERPLTELPKDAGLLVLIEPVARPLQDAEVSALQEWLNQGGTLLLVAVPATEAESPSNLGFEEARAEVRSTEDGTAKVAAKSPYGRDVTQIKISGASSIDVRKPTTVQKLVTSGSDVYAATWREKQGRVIFVADAVAFDNDRLRTGALDNPVFYLNVGQQSTGPARPFVLFDEYHQGFGARKAVGKTLWAALGPGLRAAAWYLLFGFLLLIYALNRRFGPARTLPTNDYRSSTEYIASMAGLYQRSGAGMLAIETIQRDFLRDLGARLDMEPTAGPDALAEAAHIRFGWDAADLASLLRQSADAIAAPGHVTRQAEPEIVKLGQRLHAYRAELNSRKA